MALSSVAPSTAGLWPCLARPCPLRPCLLCPRQPWPCPLTSSVVGLIYHCFVRVATSALASAVVPFLQIHDDKRQKIRRRRNFNDNILLVCLLCSYARPPFNIYFIFHSLVFLKGFCNPNNNRLLRTTSHTLGPQYPITNQLHLQAFPTVRLEPTHNLCLC